MKFAFEPDTFTLVIGSIIYVTLNNIHRTDNMTRVQPASIDFLQKFLAHPWRAWCTARPFDHNVEIDIQINQNVCVLGARVRKRH